MLIGMCLQVCLDNLFIIVLFILSFKLNIKKNKLI